MTQRIFKNVFMLTMTVFVTCIVLLTSVLYSFFAQKKVEELHSETQLLALAVEAHGTGFMGENTEKSEMRITLIGADGAVLFDNSADPSQMGNHLDREEIREAFETGHGESGRFSDTLSAKTINCAVRLSDGTVLRVSVMQYTFSEMIVSMFFQIVFMLILAILLSALMAARVSKAVIRPINLINLHNPDEGDVYEELRPLVRRINLQNRQLQAQLSQIQQEHDKQDQMRREFTANVSHELKTPLTSISGFAEILRAGLVKPEDTPRFAGNIYTEAQRMIALVNDILRLSRLDGENIQETWESIDLYELCAEQIRRLQPLASRNNIAFQLVGSSASVGGFQNILEEIVYNLCDNAVKYNKENGTVTVTVQSDAVGVRLSVRDTGIGIPEEEIPRIFERFYRVDKSHSREMGGTGLGLSIVKHAAQLHHATIQVHSVVGDGTEISLQFPHYNGISTEIEKTLEVP